MLPKCLNFQTLNYKLYPASNPCKNLAPINSISIKAPQSEELQSPNAMAFSLPVSDSVRIILDVTPAWPVL